MKVIHHGARYPHPYDLIMGGKRRVEVDGTLYEIDLDALALMPHERDMSPWRRLRRYRYGQAGLIDPLDRTAA